MLPHPVLISYLDPDAVTLITAPHPDWLPTSCTSTSHLQKPPSSCHPKLEVSWLPTADIIQFKLIGNTGLRALSSGHLSVFIFMIRDYAA